MRFVTPVDRLLHLGGDGVTMLFWALALGGGLAFAITDLPDALTISAASTGTTVYWFRWRNMTVAGLLRRIAFTRLRDGDPSD